MRTKMKLRQFVKAIISYENQTPNLVIAMEHYDGAKVVFRGTQHDITLDFVEWFGDSYVNMWVVEDNTFTINLTEEPNMTEWHRTNYRYKK